MTDHLTQANRVDLLTERRDLRIRIVTHQEHIDGLTRAIESRTGGRDHLDAANPDHRKSWLSYAGEIADLSARLDSEIAELGALTDRYDRLGQQLD